MKKILVLILIVGFLFCNSATDNNSANKGKSGEDNLQNSFLFFLNTRSIPISITNTNLNINTFSPASSVVGLNVQINGSNFSKVVSSNIVKFNGTLATVTLASSDSLTVIVPEGATSGPITVTVDTKTSSSKTDFKVSNLIPLTMNANYISGTTINNSEANYYSASLKSGKVYYLSWDDSFGGSGNYTADVAVVVINSNRNVLFYDIDSGYLNHKKIISTATENIFIQVINYSGFNSGTFGIKISESLSYNSLNSGSLKDLFGISCPDPNTCYAVGDTGTVLKTTNSGTNWSAQSSGVVLDLRSISCVNINTCLSVGKNGTILKTFNGSTWNPQTSTTTNNLLSIVCLNLNTCYVSGTNGTILKTIDGGLNWLAQTSSAGTNSLNQITCIDSNNCFVGGTNGMILKTLDGSNWFVVNSGTKDSISGIACSNTNNCYYTKLTLYDYGRITSNGGVSFSELQFGEYLSIKRNGNCISGTSTCVFAGSNGTIVFTSNGSSWAPHSTSITGTLNNAVCTSDTQCFGIGNNGIVIRGN